MGRLANHRFSRGNDALIIEKGAFFLASSVFPYIKQPAAAQSGLAQIVVHRRSRRRLHFQSGLGILLK